MTQIQVDGRDRRAANAENIESTLSTSLKDMMFVAFIDTKQRAVDAGNVEIYEMLSERGVYAALLISGAAVADSHGGY